MMIGSYRGFYCEPSKEELEESKKILVEELCEDIRRIAKEYPEEFFIINDTRDFPIGITGKTIGVKIDVPTVSHKIKELKITKSNLKGE